MLYGPSSIIKSSFHPLLSFSLPVLSASWLHCWFNKSFPPFAPTHGPYNPPSTTFSLIPCSTKTQYQLPPHYQRACPPISTSCLHQPRTPKPKPKPANTPSQPPPPPSLPGSVPPPSTTPPSQQTTSSQPNTRVSPSYSNGCASPSPASCWWPA